MTKKATKTGKQLEEYVADAYRALGARRVEHDVELAGHQIDVYVELDTQDSGLHRIAIEAKDRASTIGIRVVNDFLTIVDHLRRERLIDEGIVVSVTDFSKQARNAGRTGCVRLLKLNDLKKERIIRHWVEEYLISVRKNEVLLADLDQIRRMVSYLGRGGFTELSLDNPGAILERVVQQITEQERCRLACGQSQMPSTKELCRLLSYLGWYMRNEDIVSCRARDAAAVISEILIELRLDQYDADQVLDWLTATCWLRKAGHGEIEFQDFYATDIFAALELKERFSTVPDSATLGLGPGGNPTCWQKAIIFLAGVLDPDQTVRLLDVLLEVGLVQLAGWCMAEGQPVPQFMVARVVHKLLTQPAGEIQL